MSENRDHTGRRSRGAGIAAQDQPAQQRALEAADTQIRPVLTQRVIALNGVVERSERRALVASAPAPASHVEPALAPPPPDDLSVTRLEWGGLPIGANAALPDAPKVAVAQPEKKTVDAEWATHSSIALELCDESRLSQSLLAMNIEDAETKTYDPARALRAAVSIADLASLDRALESAGVVGNDEFDPPTIIREAPGVVEVTAALPQVERAPRMLVLPASVVWTVLGAFAVFALLLVYLLTAFLVCGHPSLFDPARLRCVPQADVARAG